MYFGFPKKLISPGVASASDAAPVICSDGSPINSPPDVVASSCRVKVIAVLTAVTVGRAVLCTPRLARECKRYHSPCRRFAASFFMTPLRRPLFDEGLHAFKGSVIHHVTSHALTRCFIRGGDAEFSLFVKEFFSHRHCDAGLRYNRSNEFFNL